MLKHLLEYDSFDEDLVDDLVNVGYDDIKFDVIIFTGHTNAKKEIAAIREFNKKEGRKNPVISVAGEIRYGITSSMEQIGAMNFELEYTLKDKTVITLDASIPDRDGSINGFATMRVAHEDHIDTDDEDLVDVHEEMIYDNLRNYTFGSNKEPYSKIILDTYAYEYDLA